MINYNNNNNNMTTVILLIGQLPERAGLLSDSLRLVLFNSSHSLIHQPQQNERETTASMKAGKHKTQTT